VFKARNLELDNYIENIREINNLDARFQGSIEDE